MGASLVKSATGESSEVVNSKMLDAKLDLVAEDEARRMKVVVLGLPRSGKSTLVKQIKTLELTSPFTEEERRASVRDVHRAIIASMQTLILQAQSRNMDPLPTLVESVMGADPAAPLTVDVAQAVSALWLTDAAVRAAYACRHLFEWDDSAALWFTLAVTVASPGWTPRGEDVVRARHGGSRGIQTDHLFTDDGELFFVDVGGQSSERKKWTHTLSDAVAVVFVVSLADFDRVSDGDAEAGRLQEAMVAFAEAANSPWFDSASFFLALNKSDLFEERIKSVDLRFDGTGGGGGGGAAALLRSPSQQAGGSSQRGKEDVPPARFLDYRGGCSYYSALAYVQERFLELSRRPADRAVVPLVLTATDPASTRPAYDKMRVIVSKHFIEMGGGAGDSGRGAD